MNKQQAGFTLIEVLVAVAVLAIGLLAVTRVTSIAIRNSDYLQQKTIAHWVAMNVLANAQVGLTMTPAVGGTQRAQETELGQTFNWQMTATAVPNLPMLQLQVQVLNPKTQRPLDTMQNYVANPEANK